MPLALTGVMCVCAVDAVAEDALYLEELAKRAARRRAAATSPSTTAVDRHEESIPLSTTSTPRGPLSALRGPPFRTFRGALPASLCVTKTSGTAKQACRQALRCRLTTNNQQNRQIPPAVLRDHFIFCVRSVMMRTEHTSMALLTFRDTLLYCAIVGCNANVCLVARGSVTTAAAGSV
jgi:hypothetical protein